MKYTFSLGVPWNKSLLKFSTLKVIFSITITIRVVFLLVCDRSFELSVSFDVINSFYLNFVTFMRRGESVFDVFSDKGDLVVKEKPSGYVRFMGIVASEDVLDDRHNSGV